MLFSRINVLNHIRTEQLSQKMTLGSYQTKGLTEICALIYTAIQTFKNDMKSSYELAVVISEVRFGSCSLFGETGSAGVSGTSYPPAPCIPGYTMPRHRIPPGTRCLGMEYPPERGTPCLDTVYPPVHGA